jgi:hypothetical protein
VIILVVLKVEKVGVLAVILKEVIVVVVSGEDKLDNREGQSSRMLKSENISNKDCGSSSSSRGLKKIDKFTCFVLIITVVKDNCQ